MPTLNVDASLGNDANTYAQVAAGTHSWASIGRAAWGSTNREARVAAQAAAAGDTTEVEDGTYSVQQSGDRFAPGFITENTGSIGSLITFKAMGEVIIEGVVNDSGTASSATASSLSDTSKVAWTEGQWGAGGDYALHITGSSDAPTAVGQIRWINNNAVATTLTLTEDFAVTPEGTITYRIIKAGPVAGGFTDKDYIKWTVDDIATCKWVINAVDTPAHADTGHVILYDCNDCTVEGFEINGDRAFWSDNYNGIRLENADACIVKNNWIDGIRHTSATSHNGAGVMTYSAYNCTIEHNEITDSGSGINIKGESFSAQTANIVRYNRIDGCQNGIRVDFSLGAGNSQCYQNIIVNGASGGNGINIGNDVRRWTFHNNTIHNVDGGQGIYYSSGAARTAVAFRDNLLTSCPTAIDLSELAAVTAEDSLDYDHVYVSTRFGAFNGGNKATRANFFADVAREQHGGDADPLYTNAAGGDFTLQLASTARASSSTSGPVGAYITGNEEIGVQSELDEGGGLSFSAIGFPSIFTIFNWR